MALARAAAPGGRQLAGGIGIAELQLPDLDADGRWRGRCRGADRPRRLDAPIDQGLETVEGHQRLLEHAGQLQRAAVQHHTCLAATLGGLHLGLGLPPAGAAGLGRLRSRRGRHRDADQPGLELVALRVLPGAFPAGGQVLDPAFGRRLGQRLARVGRHRHGFADARQQRQVESIGTQLARRGRLVTAACVTQGEAEVALRPGQTIVGGEADALARQAPATVVTLALQPALHLLQRHRQHLGRQPQGHLAQRQVQRGAIDLAIGHFGPQAQRAVALGQLEGQVDVAAQLRHVGARQRGVGGARPVAPVARAAEQPAAELAAQRKALAPGRRRRGIQPQCVAVQAVADDQVHVAEHQRGQAAQLVCPAQRAAADGQLMLFKQPVCRGVAVRALGVRQLDAGHEDAPLCVAPHVQRGRVDQQLFQAQLQRQQ